MSEGEADDDDVTGLVRLRGEQLGLPQPFARELNADEVDTLVRTAKELAAPTEYLFGGCESRAHALWRLVSTELQASVGKVWLLPFDKYTYLPLRGTLRPMEHERVQWGYHVALAYRAAEDGQLWILDLAFGSNPIEPSVWLSRLEVPPATLWLTTDGSQFSFNTEAGGCDARGKAQQPNSVSCWDRSRLLLNGNFFAYEFHAETDDIRRNLARDSAGSMLVSGTTCSSLASLAEQPNSLRDTLHQITNPDRDPESLVAPSWDRATDLDISCLPVLDEYWREWRRLNALLPE